MRGRAPLKRTRPCQRLSPRRVTCLEWSVCLTPCKRCTRGPAPLPGVFVPSPPPSCHDHSFRRSHGLCRRRARAAVGCGHRAGPRRRFRVRGRALHQAGSVDPHARRGEAVHVHLYPQGCDQVVPDHDAAHAVQRRPIRSGQVQSATRSEQRVRARRLHLRLSRRPGPLHVRGRIRQRPAAQRPLQWSDRHR